MDDLFLYGYEEHDYASFRKNHICPDRQPHDNMEFKVSLTSSSLSGIGRNLYVKCERCGCMQDITDYGEW